MGCGVSKKVGTTLEDKDFKMSSSKLTFTQRQLMRLNKRFLNLLEHRTSLGIARERQSANLGVVVERLIQKLVCSIGNMDPRFSSKFLVNLEPFKNYNSETRRSIKYKYLIRLDLISSPALYPEFFEPPVRIIEDSDNHFQYQGYARIKVHGEFLEQWTEFISHNGFLRRDKIQERFVELLTRAVANPSEPLSPAEVDESRLCGSPGKILDPITLHHVLKASPSQQFYFGPPECNESRFPDPRDFRIAIVEGVPETKLHVSFLSPAAQMTGSEEFEISLILGVGVSGWPSASDFPSRLPFDHVDVILAYEAAQMDYYLVPQGPHSSLYCEDKLSLWEIRPLATEMFLQHHYSSTSTIFKIYKILIYLREILKAKGVKVITSYILKTLLFFELEHKKHIQDWAPEMLSRRILSILDRVHNCLRCQKIPNYFFTERNLLLQSGTIEEDFFSDGDILEYYIKLLHNDGYKIDPDEGKYVPVQDQLENVMLRKWNNVIENMRPPMSNRNRRLSVINNSSASITYTRQQLEYISLLIQEVLKVKNLQKSNEFKESEGDRFEKDFGEVKKNKEDFIYLLQLMFDQAKKFSRSSQSGFSKTKINRFLKMDEILLSYDISTSMLIDDIRRKNFDFSFVDDVSVVIKIMEYLYQAIDSDGKVLGQILRPYLNQIFRGSHENCWFLQEWKKRTDLSEMNAIGIFSSLVLSGQISPLEGILDAANKGWTWAKTTLHILQKLSEEASARIITGEKIDLNESGLKLIFTPGPAKTIRFNLKSTKENKNEGKRKKNGKDNRTATIRSYQELLDSAINAKVEAEKKILSQNDGSRSIKSPGEKVPHHLLLKEGNPLTVASLEVRRRGNHRGLGKIIQALISLKKLTVLQEISQYLPENEKINVLNDINKLFKEIQRLSVENYRKKNSTSNEKINKNRFSFKKTTKIVTSQQQQQQQQSLGKDREKKEFTEVYRIIDSRFPRLENAIQTEPKIKQNFSEEKQENTLLKICRQIRRQNRLSIFDLNNFQSVTTFNRCDAGETISKFTINGPYASNHRR